jgi:arylsulfatase A-like enzyme
VRWIVGAIALALLGAAAPVATPPAAPATPPNILVLTIDSLRADRLGCYTGGARATAGIDALAAQGVRFTRAYTASVSTAPANASILTGVYPVRHGIRHDLGGRLADTVTPLAQRLRDRGYATAAVVGSFHLDSERGLDRGFDHYDDDIKGIHKEIIALSKERRASEVVEKGLIALDALPRDKPWFLWLNLYDPHYDYDPPEPEKSAVTTGAYDAEVLHVDHQIEALLKNLKGRDPAGRIVVVLAGTHGEGLGDHQEIGHGIYLYETTVRVPLVIVPGGAAGAAGVVVESPISLVDLAPTLLELAGAVRPEGLDGRSLVPLLAGPGSAASGPGARKKSAEPARPLYVEAMAPRAAYGWSALYAVIDGAHKVVQGKRLEAFDLAADPGETAPLPKPPRWARGLVETGAGFLGNLEPAEPRRSEMLAAAAGLHAPWENSPFCVEKGDWPDPRDPERVALAGKLFSGRIEMDKGMIGRSLRVGQEVLESDPANLSALDFIAFIGIRNHWGTMLVDYLELLQCNYPFRGEGYHYLGHYYFQEGESEKALEAFRVMGQVEPWNGEAEYDQAAVLLMLQRKDEAFEHLKSAVALGSNDFEFMRKDARLGGLRDDPRFKELMAPR